MPDDAKPMQRFSRAAIEDFMQRCFVATGFPSDDAGIIARFMAESDIMGKDSHGIFRLPAYIGRVQGGGFNKTPNIRIEQERTATALVDGDNGMGHLVINYCAELAIRKAKQTGVSWVGVHHSNHAGAAGAYAMLPLAHDMIGIYVAVGSANHLPPWGGTESMLSTNPIAVAIPGMEEDPILLDMATTVTSYGKVKVHAQRGIPMPEGWMIDRDGNSMTDASLSDSGFLLPIGGAKGYGLALIFGILAGTLNGAAFGKDVVDMNADNSSVTNTGQFIIALDIAAFMDVDKFKREIDDVVRQMRSSATLTGVESVRMPGEGSHAAIADRMANGIPLPVPLLDGLRKVANELNVSPLD
ncbi:MAG: L-2-hydroxycarboxylate dehydrogenase (NAD+) [Alphaproteobacteria bacterium]|jgi:L-2-hydroxycarboxylate dehydrogenase (NAD+)